MNLLSSTIKDTMDQDHFHISESRDSETDTYFTALITHSCGDDHYHTELSIDECKKLRDFLDKLITKSDKKGGKDPLY